MQSLFNFTKSGATKVIALALVAALGLSFVGEGNAAGAFKQFTVTVVNSSNNQAISGAEVVIVNGPDDGAAATTNAQGQATFYLNPAVFNIHISHGNFQSKDYNSIVLTADRTFAAQLDPLPTQNPTNPGLHQFTVSVHESNAGPAINGAQVVIVNGPDDGTAANTNSSGVATFFLHSGVFNLHISANGYNSKDYNSIVLTGPSNFSAQLDKVGNNNPTGCQPTPPSGRPLLNIWPIATSGADCTDYPLLSVRNVTKNTGYTHGSNVAASTGDVLRVQMYVHNGTVDLPQNEAINVMVKANVPSSTGTAVITAEAWANNADRINSGSKGGNTTVTMGSGQSLAYVPGSARLYDRGPSNERGLSDAVVGSGASVGNMRGCFPYLHFVTFEVRVNGPTQPPVTPPTPVPPVVPPVIPPTPIPPVIPPTPTPVAPGGYLDMADCTAIAGWATDSDTPNTPVTVHVYMDGPAGTGTLVATAVANQFRADVGNHAFHIATPAAFKDGNAHTAYVYAIDTQNPNSAVLLPGSPRTINCVVTAIPGTISLTKQARNVTQGQTAFQTSIGANPGDTVEFRMVATANNGAVNNVTFTDTLPSRLSYVSGTFTVDGTASGNNLSGVSLGTINAGQSKTMTLRAQVASATQFPDNATSLTNTARVDSSQGPATAQAYVNVLGTTPENPTLTLTKHVRNVTQGQSSFQSSVSASTGDTVEFRIVAGAQSGTITNAFFTDNLPSRLNFINGTFTVDGVNAGGNLSGISLGSITAGQTKTMIFRATVADSSQFSSGTTVLTNTARVESTQGSRTADASVSVTVSQVINPGSAALSVQKLVRNVTTNNSFTSQVSALPNETVQFRIVVQSTGAIAANDVRVTDFLPSGLTYLNGSFVMDGSYGSGNVFSGGQYLGTLYPGQTRTMTFNAQVSNSYSQFLTNTVQAYASNASTVSAQASVSVGSVQGGNINLILSKRAYNQTRAVDATTVTAQSGDVIVYTLRVQNTGNADATSYVFQDNIGDVLQLAQLQDFPGASFDLLHNLVWQSVNIPANSFVEKTFTVKVNSTRPANTDYVMSNFFGNTVNVNVGRGVLGDYTAPQTGPAAGIVLALSAATVATVGFRRREELLSAIKGIKS